ncbi:MAG: DUF4262 domain-containing protein [Mycolicibacterium rufum]|uniref:DUF4262 domain-containing protein n=1 Tax=Mycolicibacterium chlorophenolicum TaxID=37916 RepID=A0A0J6VKW3_9MYCO|nr:DUF4262 domain-containing protein [Mycolicibacterium chlorophenolicum]KMO70197.1 hypothetical protein MCHLDSM_05085 [Mycolicibacterium chlorophenolicum]MBI5338487.1 DUF4262 domain-containing protein [Mycolicibacterium rufum]
MCWLCDHPTATRQDYLNVLREKVLRNGWTIQYVEDTMPFAYTVGLSDESLPELMVTSVSAPRALRLLGAMAVGIRQGVRWNPGDLVTIDNGPLVELVEVDHPDVHCGWAVRHAEGPIRVLQAVWADGRGRWPWSPTFCDGWRRQPVLGLRSRVA